MTPEQRMERDQRITNELMFLAKYALDLAVAFRAGVGGDLDVLADRITKMACRIEREVIVAVRETP
jgi:hypothetical protein